MEYLYLIYANKKKTKNHKRLTSKSKNKNLQYPKANQSLKIRAKTLNIQKQM